MASRRSRRSRICSRRARECLVIPGQGLEESQASPVRGPSDDDRGPGRRVNENLILNVENVVQVTEQAIAVLNKEKEELTSLWTSWKLNMSQVKSIKEQCGKFNEQFKTTTQSLNALQEALQSATALDLGSNLSVLVELQDKFNQMKPQFQQLNAEVEYTLKLSEQLSSKGVPDMEKSEKVSELIHLHKEIKERIETYDEFFNKTVKFHYAKEQLESLIKSGGLEVPEIKEVPSDTPHVKTHLNNAQEKHARIRQLYKLALTLGMDIISTVQHPNPFNVSVKNLRQQLEALESDSASWGFKADKYEEDLSHVLHFCTTRDEIHEGGTELVQCCMEISLSLHPSAGSQTYLDLGNGNGGEGD
uniref:Uncharacterized protein n=1 Tax=Sphaerodactylus townsendi TaxID=933632 RepID=A0ACB8G036_9SAUR